MNKLPLELQYALQRQRLLIVWGEVPFELPPRVTGERVVLINRLIADAVKLPAISIRLSATPPLPILSLDPTDRIEREFQAAGRALRVVKSSQDSATPTRHTLIKLAGDLNSRTGLILSRDEIQRLSGDEDKRYLLDLLRRITAEGSAVVLVGCDPANADFLVWWSIIHPLVGSAPIFAMGEPATEWPEGVTHLGSVHDVIDALANLETPPPKMESATSFEASAEKGLPTDVGRSIGNASATASQGGTAVGAIQVGGNSGSINIGNTTVIINEATPTPAPQQAPTPLEVQTLRVDAAVPEQVFVDRVFDLAVAVRQLASPLLAMKDLTHVESGEMQTTWEAGAPLINLRAEVEAPDCEIVGKSSIQFRLARGKDAPPNYFHLKPRRAGELSIIVTVYQEDYALGSARVSTLAAEQTTQPAGKVQLTVTSQPLWLDCELRIFDAIDQRYRVELTLNGEQTFGGTLNADLATWVATSDPVADGQALFKALLADNELLKAWGEARGRSKQRRVRLRIDPPALHAVPWEMLRDGDELFAADADTPFSRYLAIGKEWGRPLTDRPICVLAVISNPSDLGEKYNLPSADVKLEEKTMREAFSPLSLSGRGVGGEGVSLTILTPPITFARLEAELRDGYHVLHFIGHGGFNAKQQQAALYFENDDHTARRVIDADFAGMLDRLQTPPQLVMLAACQSATQSLHDVFSGLAPRLVQIGLPAVVAMHADVTLLTARHFAATFYRQLVTHGTIDLAMNEARSTLITNGRFDAAVPVLFMRLRDGRLWGEAPRAPAQPIEPPQSIGRTPLSTEDRASLERQLKDMRDSLQVIEEHKAKYVQATDIPLQYLKEERRLRATIAELEAKLRGVN